MMSKSNILAGIAAASLAVLFPIYWIYAFGAIFSTNSAELIADDFLTLNGWDALFVIIGLLEIIVYIGLYKLCREQLNGGLSAILLLIMAAVIAVFHSTVVIDILLASGMVTSNSEAWMSWGVVISLSLLFFYAVVAFILAVTFLTRLSELSNIMKAFSFGLLVMCILQLTVVLAAANIVLFPILMVLVAIQFFRNDHSVEIV